MSYTPEVILENVSDQEELWHEEREKRLNASEIPIVTGLMPEVGTPMQIWAQKLHLEPRPEQTDAMFLGHASEPVIARMVERKLGTRVVPVNQYMSLKELPWLGGTPDYITDDGKVLHQFKTAHWMAKKHWEEGIPDYAHIQIQLELALMGMKYGRVDALVGNRDFYSHEVELNEGILEQLILLGKDFWDKVMSKTPPIPLAEDAGRMNRLQKDLIDDLAEMDDTLYPLIENYKLLKADEKVAKDAYEALESKRKALELRLRQEMQGHSHCRCRDVILKQTRVDRKEYTAKASTYYNFGIKEA